MRWRSSHERGAAFAGTSADTSLRITYWEDSANASSSVTWTLRCDPARGTLARPARACARLAAGGHEALRTTPAERRLHRDLRRATEGASRRRGRREARVVDLHADERLPDRPLAAHLALARASGRRHELTASLVTIGGREDRPLRRRRAPPAPRDRAGPQRAACASQPSTGTPRRRALPSADVAEVVDFSGCRRGGGGRAPDRRRRRADRSPADRAVPVVAAVAEELGLPGIGTQTAHRPDAQARDADALGAAAPSATSVREPPLDRRCRRRAREGRASRPSSSLSTRAASAPSFASRRATSSSATSPKRSPSRRRDEAILEEFVDGIEMNGIVIARIGEPALDHAVATACAHPASASASGWIHVYPPSIPASSCALAGAARTSSRCARSGSPTRSRSRSSSPLPIGSVDIVEVAARIPGGQMADVVRHAVGVDLVEVAFCRHSARTCPTTSRCRVSRSPSRSGSSPPSRPAPDRRASLADRRASTPCSPSEGVVQADTYLQIGETIRPVRRDGDRRGYVIAIADTSDEALAVPRPPPADSTSRWRRELLAST